MRVRKISDKTHYHTICILLFVAAVCLRWQTFGDPMIDIDEEFYLFTGGRLLQGDLPFVDIWDRKPAGLFLLYAFFHLFGSWRILAYQSGALLSLCATAILVWRMARTIAPAGGALFAALLYEIWPVLAGGEGGQTPIFYNLLTAAAMIRIVFYLPELKNDDAFRRKTGLIVMLFFGLAIQIKYTVIFEGIFAGMYLLWLGWQKKCALLSLLTDAVLWVSCALIPTCAVFLFYWIKGYGHIWWFANIESIFFRKHMEQSAVTIITLQVFTILAPFIFCWLIRKLLSIKFQNEQKERIIFFNIWSVFAVAGLFILGSWYKHYTLPVLLPLSVQVAPLWRKKSGQVLLIVMACGATFAGQKILSRHLISQGNTTLFRELQAAISSPPGCVFIYNGPPMLYDTPAYCKLTTHPFPPHFHQATEANSTGMNAAEEITSVLSQKPTYIITSENDAPDTDDDENMAAHTRLYNTLRTDYMPTYHHHFKHHSLIVYTRKAVITPPQSPRPE